MTNAWYDFKRRNFNYQRLELSVEYKDDLKVSLTSRLLLNLPSPKILSLPIELSITLQRFSGTIYAELYDKEIRFGLLNEIEIEFKVDSVIGAKTKLINLPKVSRMVRDHLSKLIQEKLYHPKFKSFKM